VSGGAPPDELDELRFHWGTAYDIDAADGVCTARRRDGTGGPLADSSPEGLRQKIQADYAADPVPRIPAVNGGMSDDDRRVLDALTLAWGDTYEIYLVGGRWQAWRDEADDDDMLTGSTAAELNLVIRADWARKGMP